GSLAHSVAVPVVLQDVVLAVSKPRQTVSCGATFSYEVSVKGGKRIHGPDGSRIPGAVPVGSREYSIVPVPEQQQPRADDGVFHEAEYSAMLRDDLLGQVHRGGQWTHSVGGGRCKYQWNAGSNLDRRPGIADVGGAGNCVLSGDGEFRVRIWRCSEPFNI